MQSSEMLKKNIVDLSQHFTNLSWWDTTSFKVNFEISLRYLIIILMWQRQISKYRLYMELHDGNFNFQSPWGVNVSPCTQVQATSLKSTGFSSAFYK